MATQIHTLRNRLAKAVLTATALVDGKLRPDKANLSALAQALGEVSALVATVPKYALEDGAAGDHLVDTRKLIDSVVSELALISDATGVALTAEPSEPGEARCRVLRGPSAAIYAALEGAAHLLLTMLPIRSSVAIAARSAETIMLTVRLADADPATETALLERLAPVVERHGALVHALDAPGTLCLHLPGERLCVDTEVCAQSGAP
jgi:hypothetical protein